MIKSLFFLLIACAICFSQEIGARYLIITHDDFYDAIQPLAQWKHRKGMRTKVVKLSETGSSASQIKDYIEDAYNTWQIPPEFLLLVGAPYYLPFPQVSYVYSDNYYTDMDDNLYNDILSGRLTVHDTTEAQTVVNKILLYERTPDISDSSWFINACLIIREDYDPWDDSIYWSDINHAKNHMLNHGYNIIDTLCRIAGNNANDIIQAVNDGGAFVLYRGCGVGNWWSPFNVNPELTQNGTKLPIVLSITSRTIGTGSTPATAERWLLTGEPSLPRGGAGFFATTTTVTNGAYLRSAVCKGFFNAVFQDGKRTFGEACEGGRINVYTLYNSASEYRGFITLGDPEMNIWTAIPKAIEVLHDSLLTIVDDSLHVLVQLNSVPVESALVCIVFDTLVYQYGYTSNNGEITFYFDTLYPGVMDITVTAHNKIPYLDSIPIVPTYVEEAVQSITTHLCNISVLPNPFSRKTIIHFSFSQNNQKTKIEIFDSIGRRVKEYIIGELNGVIIWQGTDDKGNYLPTGVYFLRIVPSMERQSIPVVLLR
ncbi:T9SS type A sorting domain-containing protein [candidate division WOR-3 bacterium]|nr:T9SS type A sorting domain-containing protein [candidate division WOR-3 bacterium]